MKDADIFMEERMKKKHDNTDMNEKKSLFHSKGVTWFDKKTERAFFFILTVIMLLWGIMTKLTG